jgi:hypothetical protein
VSDATIGVALGTFTEDESVTLAVGVSVADFAMNVIATDEVSVTLADTVSLAVI